MILHTRITYLQSLVFLREMEHVCIYVCTYVKYVIYVTHIINKSSRGLFVYALVHSKSDIFVLNTVSYKELRLGHTVTEVRSPKGQESH